MGLFVPRTNPIGASTLNDRERRRAHGEVAVGASAAPNIQGFGTSEALIDGPMIKIYTPIDNVAVPNGLQPGARPAMTLPA